jgi:hypothetical protein
MKLDPIRLVSATPKLDDKTKRRIVARMTVVQEVISEIENMSGISYPVFYIDPVLTVSISPDNNDGIGILYARTIPVETRGNVEIVIQLSAALVLFSTKSTLRLVLAHELLHYLELVKRFSSGEISSQLSSTSIFEEQFDDSRRTVDPLRVFPKKRKLAKDLTSNFLSGFSDDKLNEKCRKSWIEKGLPTVKMSMGANQVKISVEALARSSFDPKVLELMSKLESAK